MSESQFVNQLVYMLAEDMQPMAIVERSGFKKFCNALPPHYTLPSRRTVGRRLNEVYNAEKDKIIESLNKARWVSATADVWSAHKRAYMGVTVHFVDSETLHMISSGSHTGDAIGRMLAKIFEEFGITKKFKML